MSEFPCVDCGQIRTLDTEAVILRTRGVCGFCYTSRAIQDYQDWCGSMGVDYDSESADEYLYITNYGNHLPEWIQVRVRDWAVQQSGVDSTLRCV